MKVKTLEELVNEGALEGKRVFIRADMNVPRDAEGNVTDDHRLKESMPAVKMALKGGAGVMVCSHLGRPKEGELTEQDSLAKVAETFGKMLGMPIRFEKEWLDGVDVKPGEVVILENCRGNVGEKKNDPELVKKMAKLCDIYVNDAFGTAHRAQATTDGLAREAEVACAGPLLAKEIKALTEEQIEDFIREAARQIGSVDLQSPTLSTAGRLDYAKNQVLSTVRKVAPYVLVGVAIGAAIHNFIPQAFVERVLGSGQWYSVPLATLVGAPMYADIFGTIPIAESLYAKGAGLGTVLSFMMAVTALSLPSLVMLRKAVKPKLLAVFTGIVTVGIMGIGFLFNLVGPLFA